jgi:hypothetical protein
MHADVNVQTVTLAVPGTEPQPDFLRIAGPESPGPGLVGWISGRVAVFGLATFSFGHFVTHPTNTMAARVSIKGVPGPTHGCSFTDPVAGEGYSLITGSDRVQSIGINWGDDSPLETFTAPYVTSVDHIFPEPGDYTVTAWARFEPGRAGGEPILDVSPPAASRIFTAV